MGDFAEISWQLAKTKRMEKKEETVPTRESPSIDTPSQSLLEDLESWLRDLYNFSVLK